MHAYGDTSIYTGLNCAVEMLSNDDESGYDIDPYPNIPEILWSYSKDPEKIWDLVRPCFKELLGKVLIRVFDEITISDRNVILISLFKRSIISLV